MWWVLLYVCMYIVGEGYEKCFAGSSSMMVVMRNEGEVEMLTFEGAHV